MPMSASNAWTIRALVLGAFAVTVWLCGPSAMTALASRFAPSEHKSPPVELDRVGFVERPEWLTPPLLLAVSTALSPWLSGQLGLLDDAEARQLREQLATVPWVREVLIERQFPDRLRLRCGLRRPVLAVRAGDGTPLCLVDQGGVMLPWVDTELPLVRLHAEGGRPSMTVVAGERAPDRRVSAAAAIAVEWREQLAPLVPQCPPLLEIDTTNLGERWVQGPEYPEVRVLLGRGDGAPVVFGYGRPVDSPLPRVPVQVKATVLGQVLAKHPRLDGLVAGDLRFARRWADYLQPRAPGVPDPNGPWKELPLPR